MAVAAVALAACGDGSSSDDGSEEGASTGAGDALVLGGVGPLSEPGDVASGQQMEWAMKRAIDDLNADGGILGRQVEITFEDTQGQPDVAASVAKRMIDRNEAVAVAGEVNSGGALGAIPTYSDAGLPVVFVDTWDDRITGGDPEDPTLPANPATIFRIAPSTSYTNDVQMTWLRDGVEAKKVVHVVEASEYGIAATATLQESLGDNGIALETVEVELNQPDYTSVLSRIATEHEDADVLFLDVTGESGQAIVRNAIDSGVLDGRKCLANSTIGRDAEFWAAAPDGVGCVFPVIGPLPSETTDEAAALAEAYESDTGSSPIHVIYYSYDAIMLLADAIERAGSTDSAAIVTALEETDYRGLAGPYVFPFGSANQLPADEPSWRWHQLEQPGFHLSQYTERDQAKNDAPVVWPPEGQTDAGTAYHEVDR